MAFPHCLDDSVSSDGLGILSDIGIGRATGGEKKGSDLLQHSALSQFPLAGGILWSGVVLGSVYTAAGTLGDDLSNHASVRSY